ncbi:hypothetical protein ACFQ07_30895 [Actinomadura adrarensis]|uniref:Uncharacterized protein n=1 Tax=Actinomadura adrarensis TaxID=1819600 RepID=A0ABW3CRX9_9ACTN
MPRMVDVGDLVTTRRALHGVAELIMAGPQYRRSGSIRLAITPNGFGTTGEPVLRVDGTELIAGTRMIPLNGATCGELGTAADLDAGAPEDLYKGGSGVGLDDVLGVDAGAAELIEESLAKGAEALRRFAPDIEPVLWPEHFDVSISLDEVNYGVAAGDDEIAEPYAYVGPWGPRYSSFRYTSFWNTSFGAARRFQDLPRTDDLYDFFIEGRTRAATERP